MTHASVGLLSLSLRWLAWPWVVAGCVGGIVLNAAVLPRVAPWIFRPGESSFAGVRAYPMAVLLLALLFPVRIAAGAWAILALGDAMAALVGRTWGSAKLPWNRDKSWQGLVAFVVFGTAAGAISYGFVEARSDRTFGAFGEVYAALGSRPWLETMNAMLWARGGGALDYAIAHRPEGGGLRLDVWIAAASAAACASVAESIRVRIDDNFRTALVAGTVLLLLDPLARSIAGAVV